LEAIGGGIASAAFWPDGGDGWITGPAGEFEPANGPPSNSRPRDVSQQLTQHDVARLLAEPAAGARADIAAKIASALGSPALTARERQMAEDIVRTLAGDVVVTVRAALAHHLRHAARLPLDVARRLADDVDAVALPILAESPTLDDDSLLAILGDASAAKQQAIAGRAAVSEPVAGALITTGSEQAVAALMRNPAAHIAETSLQTAIDRFTGSEAVQDGMVGRDTLPVTVAERLAVLVSDQLRAHLVARHDLSPGLAADIVLQGRERAIIQLGRGASREQLEALLARMHARRHLTSSLVLRALCLGDMDFFETALAIMAGVPVQNARILVHDGSKRGLAPLCNKAGLPASLLPVVRVAVEVADGTTFDGGERDLERYRARVITRILTQCDGLSPDDLDWLLDKLADVLQDQSSVSPGAP
jgi:uncharacterized protein (DUF2336 family)